MILSPLTRPVLAGAVLALACLGLLLAVTCQDPTPVLPPAVVRQVEAHRVATVLDTAAINEARRAAARAAARESAAVARAASIERARVALARRADSLAAVAAIAASARDSADAWQGAYTERTAERDSLVREVAVVDSARRDADTRADTNAFARDRAIARAERADSVVASVVAAAGEAGRCSFLWVVPCPSRKVAAIGGVVLGAVAVAKGKAIARGARRLVHPP